jgi:hypothetical protein
MGREDSQMNVNWSAIAAAHVKALAAVAATATVGGGLTLATAVANSHSSSGLDTAKAAVAANSTHASPSPAVSPSPTVSPADVSSPSGHASTTVTLPSCPANVKNHGAYVSSIAKAGPSPSSSPGAFGALISAAAQSSCGKPSQAATPGASNGGSGDSGSAGTEGRPSSLPSQATQHGAGSAHGHGSGD